MEREAGRACSTGMAGSGEMMRSGLPRNEPFHEKRSRRELMMQARWNHLRGILLLGINAARRTGIPDDVYDMTSWLPWTRSACTDSANCATAFMSAV